MARRKQKDPFRYTTNLNPATAVAAAPNGGNLHGLNISDNDLPDFDSNDPHPSEYALTTTRQQEVVTLADAIINEGREIVAAADREAQRGRDVEERELQQREAALAEAIASEGHRIASGEAARAFMLAGNAYFTLRSARTGTRFTYRVAAAKPAAEGLCRWCRSNPCRCPQAFFVSLLTGPENTSDYAYMGLLKQNRFSRTRNSRITESAPGFKAFAWAFVRLIAGQLPAELEFWHEGRCGRCGRKLTVPESIAAGIGPECAQYVGRVA